MPLATPQGTLDFKSVDTITFVGASSNTVIDTTTGSFGVGVDANGPTSNLHVVGDALITGNVAVTGTGSLTVPSGTTGQRPTGVSGMIRYNSTLNVYEAWGQTEWKPLSDPPPYPFTSPFTFTNCGASGRFGPTFDEMKSAYGVSGWWQTEANFNEVLGKQGFQLWTVPKTGTYTIKAYGASGQRRQSGSQYGYGAWTQGDFSLTRGEKLVIIVGQYYDHTITGITISDYNNAGGGGGASWVLKEDYGGSGATPSSLYLVAGGGGGETANNGSGFSHAVSDAGYSQASLVTPPGTAAAGGQWTSGGGASYGIDGIGAGNPGPSKGLRPYNGADGGNHGYNSSSYNNVGGFGGGGGSGAHSAGGGGGYVGGRAAPGYQSGGGYGGSSRNNGTTITFGLFGTYSHGKVIITLN